MHTSSVQSLNLGLIHLRDVVIVEEIPSLAVTVILLDVGAVVTGVRAGTLMSNHREELVQSTRVTPFILHDLRVKFVLEGLLPIRLLLVEDRTGSMCGSGRLLGYLISVISSLIVRR